MKRPAHRTLLSAVWAVLLSISIQVSTAQAQSLTRGPYLQNGNTTAVTVRWRTSSNAASVVKYGTSAGSLTQEVSNATLKTAHELRITGLAPNTKYFYSVGTASTTLSSGTDVFFVTAPTGAKPTRIWVIGDAGTDNSSQVAVRDAYQNFTSARHTDLWLMLGDNAYDDGTDTEYQAAVFDIYPAMLRKSVVWPTLGNHDGHSANSLSQTGPYYDIFTLPEGGEAGGLQSGTEAYYSFDYGNIHFVCLNSDESTFRATGSGMLTWLQADLAANTKDWLIAFWHHPPYSKGSHNSDSESDMVQMRQNALPILESHGVDLVLTGHSHAYERSKLLNGHYGTSGTLTAAMQKNGGSGREDGTGVYTKTNVGPVANQGAVYAVAGSSGQISGGTLNHPAMFVSLNVLGSMVLDVDGNRLDAQFRDNTGARRDYFTIVKGGSGGNVAPSVALTSPSNGATFTVPASVNLAATASDSDGTVTKVDFFDGSTLIGTDSSSPYALTWSAPSGSHALTAVATDNAGATRTSSVVNITVGSGTGPTTVSFQNGTNGYSGNDDASLRSDGTTTNYGNATTLLIDGSPDYGSVMKWDLSSIPAGKTVTSASLTFNVVDTSSGTYEFYALRRATVETQCTWQRATSSVLWTTAGANDTSSDREGTVIASFAGSPSGSRTITLNAAGVAKVQSWVNNPATNLGIILLDYGVSDGLDVSSSEAATVSQRPKLTITYQ